MQAVDSKNVMVQVTRPLITLRIINLISGAASKTLTETRIESPPTEEWRPLGVNYPSYYISNFGRVKGLSGKIFNCRPNKQGYVRCGFLNVHREHVSEYVHCLVADVFIPNPDLKPVVNHKNGIRHDNRVSNLEWATQLENNGLMRLNQGRGDRCRRVIQYSIDGQPIKLWDTVADAGHSVSSRGSNISQACRGPPSLFKGFQWRYYDEMVMLENEEWKPILYKNILFQASNLGRVRGAGGGIVGSVRDDGYTIIAIKGSQVMAHRLICQAWKPTENPEMFVVNHIDNNNRNNRIENLEWVTNADNIIHYREYFYVKDTYNHGRPVKQLSKDGKTLIATFESALKASEKTGIDRPSITTVCQGKRLKSAGGFVWQYV